MILEKIARQLAIVLGPHIWLPVLFIFFVLNSGLTRDQAKIILPLVLILQVLIPLAYITFAPKLGWTSTWDMKERRERGPILILIFLINLVSIIFIYSFGNEMLLNLNVMLIALLVIFYFINRQWKISLHTGLNASGAILLNFLFNWQLLALYLTVPIVFWARLKLKKHTVNELLAGIAVSSIIILGGIFLLDTFKLEVIYAFTP